MVLKRKIYNKLLEWKKESQGKKALMVEGARRIGKSTICEEFGKMNMKAIFSLILQKEIRKSKHILIDI